MSDFRYEANWKSLSQYTCPEWFRDAKLGIFTHWGAYCVPAYKSEKYARFMYEEGDPSRAYHEKNWGNLKDFGYKDFIPMFKAEKFDAEAWVSLFKDSGAKYYIPVAEHHDGFPMYDCSYTEWSAVKMGPKRDVIAELEQATRGAGMKFGVSTHRANHWRYFNYDGDFDTRDPANAGLYGAPHDRTAPASLEFLEDWWKRTTELVQKFNPDMLYFDFFSDTPAFRPYHPRMAAFLYNHGIENGYEAILMDKNFEYMAYPPESIVLDYERGKADAIRDAAWQTDTSLGVESWCHCQDWETKSAATVLHELIDIVSKNGNLLLNVGPDASGVVPEEQRKVLLELGAWLKVNGEAIYSTRPWLFFGEGETKTTTGHHSETADSPFAGEDIRYTVGDDGLYLITLGIPGSHEVKAARLGKAEGQIVRSVEMIGSDAPVSWNQADEHLAIAFDTVPDIGMSVTFKIEIS